MNDGKITYSQQGMDTAEGQISENGQIGQGGQMSQSVQLFTLLNNQIPIQQYEGGQYQVKVFGNFTQLSDQDGTASVLEDSRLLMKRGDFIPVSAEMDYLNGRVDQVLVDSITSGNGSARYLSVLENNQRIEDYYEQIQWPEELSNAGIQEISSTLDTNDTVLMVRYTDNTVAAFNYVTGNLLFKDETEKETLSFGDYVGNWFTETWSNLWGPDTIEYDKIKVMEQELEKKPLDALLKGTETGNGENFSSGEKIVYNVNAPGGSRPADSGVSQLLSDTSALENYRKPGESGKNGIQDSQNPAAAGADPGTSGKFTGTISREGAGQNTNQGTNEGTNSGTGQGTNGMSVAGAAESAEKTNIKTDTETMSGAGHLSGTEKETGDGSTSGLDSTSTIGGLSGMGNAGSVSGDVSGAGNMTGWGNVSGTDNMSGTGDASAIDGAAVSLDGGTDREGQKVSDDLETGDSLESGQEDAETGRSDKNQSEEYDSISGETGEDERTGKELSGQEKEETSQEDGQENSQGDGQKNSGKDGQETSQKDGQETNQAAAGTVTGEGGNGTGAGSSAGMGNGTASGNPGMETGEGTGISGTEGAAGTQAMEKGENSLPKVQLDPYLPVYDPKTGTYQLYDTREYLNQGYTTEPIMSISQKLEHVGAAGMGTSKGFFGNQTGVMGYVVTVVGVLFGALVLLRCAVDRIVKH